MRKSSSLFFFVGKKEKERKERKEMKNRDPIDARAKHKKAAKITRFSLQKKEKGNAHTVYPTRRFRRVSS
jgi:hypothetical protein